MITEISVAGSKGIGSRRRVRFAACGGALLVLGALLAGCASGSDLSATGPVTISRQTNGEVQHYLKGIYPNRRGAFAISADGRNSFYFYCSDMTCSPMLYGGYASAQCESLGGGKCSLLFVNREPRVPYTVSAASSDAGRHGSLKAGIPPRKGLRVNR